MSLLQILWGLVFLTLTFILYLIFKKKNSLTGEGADSFGQEQNADSTPEKNLSENEILENSTSPVLEIAPDEVEPSPDPALAADGEPSEFDSVWWKKKIEREKRETGRSRRTERIEIDQHTLSDLGFGTENPKSSEPDEDPPN